MDDLQEKITHLKTLIPENYEKREELITGLDQTPEEGAWLYVARLFINTCGLSELLDHKNTWMREVQNYWQQFDVVR